MTSTAALLTDQDTEVESVPYVDVSSVTFNRAFSARLPAYAYVRQPTWRDWTGGDAETTTPTVWADAVDMATFTASRDRSSTWLDGVRARLCEFAELPANWDTFGASPINAVALRRAAEFLEWFASVDIPPPDVFPLSDGGARIEWHVWGIDVEIDVLPGGEELEVYYHDLRTQTEWERSGAGSEELRQVRNRLTTGRE